MANVLCASGLDPTGGAGIQADIEAIAARGAHALAVVTSLTVQDTCNVSLCVAVDATLMQQQFDALLADCPIDAIKIGLLGDASQLAVLAALIDRCSKPVVIDPILRAGGGRELVADDLASRFKQILFPRCTVLTPNVAEARRWVGHTDLDAIGEALLATGVKHVLLTGGDEPGEVVRNHWYSDAGHRVFKHARIAGPFHGAGCTLAASIAARLALGQGVEQALTEAQLDVALALRTATAVGRGRLVPRRIRLGSP